MKNAFLFTICLIFSYCLFAQNNNAYSVKAEDGDGIYSILRKQGLDPIKYYAEFIELNEARIKNGSELQRGRAYLIPNVPDSFKNKALKIGTNAEAPLFDKELGQISPKSDRLKNAVIYLLAGQAAKPGTNKVINLRNHIIQQLAEELMVNGAKVYFIDNQNNVEIKPKVLTQHNIENVENPMADISQINAYVDAINTRYLKNIGKYQRLLIINLNESVTSSAYFDVSVYHHDNSLQGERFAQNIQAIFNQNSIAKQQKDDTEVFSNTVNLYLAKNTLPAISLIDIGNPKAPSVEERISLNNDEKQFSDMIANAVLNDYAELSIDD